MTEWEEYPCTKTVEWTVKIGNGVTTLYPTDDKGWTQTSDDCIHEMFAASCWVNFEEDNLVVWKWVADNAPYFLKVEVIDERSS